MPQQQLAFSTYPHSVPLFAGGVRLVNVYPEKAEGPARSEYALIGCPGMKEFCDTGQSGPECRGFHWFNSTLYAVIGPFLFSVSSGGSATEEASGIAGTGPVRFASDNDQMVIVTTPGTDDYIYTTSSGLSQLTGTNIVDWKDVAFIDGRAVFVQADPAIDGRFSWTDANALGTVSSGSFANAESSADSLLRILKCGRLLWMLGEETAEPYRTTGDSTVFTRHANLIRPVGIAAEDSGAVIDDIGFFLAYSKQEGLHVAMISGADLRRISTNAIDRILRGSTYSDAIGFGYGEEGHLFYCLVFPTLGRTFVYDATMGSWHERQTGVNEVGSWDARHCIFAHDKVLVGHKDDGKIYELDFDTHTDAGEKRLAMFTAQMQSSGEYWNILQRLSVDMTVGEAAKGTSSEPQIMMQLSKDGGQRWSRERWKGIGLSGDYDKQVKWHGCGRFKTCLARFKITDAVPREIVKVHGSGRPGRPV